MEFLPPRLLTSKGLDEGPDEESDGWALMVTLLCYAVGGNPFRQADGMRGRTYAMVKEGDPIGWTMRDLELGTNFEGLEKAVGKEVREWFAKGFKGGWMELDV